MRVNELVIPTHNTSTRQDISELKYNSIADNIKSKVYFLLSLEHFNPSSPNVL